jgi:hypothetical protein
MQGARTVHGCLGCKRRKKGCDLRKPSCGRCQRLGITCEYGERKWTFVSANATPSSQHGSQPPGLQVVGPHTLTSTSQKSLARTEVELQTDVAFWKFCLPEVHSYLDGSIGGVISAAWIPTVRILAETDMPLRMAIQACAFECIGWVRHDLVFVEHGLRLYGNAIKETNAALHDPERVLGDAVLACCRVLSLFEMFRRNPSGTPVGRDQLIDWRSHVDGTCRLVQLRGPSRHASGSGLHLYDAVRVTAMIRGLMRREPNAFTELSWDVPGRKTLKDDLFEMARPIPGLLQQIDHLGDSLTASQGCFATQLLLHRSKEVIGTCSSIGIDLRRWKDRAIQLCRQQEAANTSSSGDREETPGLTLIEICQRHGDGFFVVCAQYWAISLMLYSSMRRFCMRLSSHKNLSGFEDAIPSLPPWANPEPHALNIAQTSRHFFRPGSGLWSAQCAVFPVGAACVYFARTGRRNSPSFKMMHEAFAETNAGAVMRDFLQNILDTPETPKC